MKCGKYVLLGKGFDTLKGRQNIDKHTTTQENPVGGECANDFQDWHCDNFGNPLLQEIGLISMSTRPQGKLRTLLMPTWRVNKVPRHPILLAACVVIRIITVLRFFLRCAQLRY